MNQRSFQTLLPAPSPAPVDTDTVLDFGALFSIIRRGWWVIGGAGIAGALIAAIIVLQIKPTYSARAQLLMSQKSQTGDVLGALVQDLNLSGDAIAGEIAIITSGRILSKVSTRLDLASRPEFNPALRPPEPEGIPIADQAIDLLRQVLGIAPPETPEAQAEDGLPNVIGDAAHQGKNSLDGQADYVGQLIQGLEVGQVGNTNLVDVQFISEDRILSAAVANVVVDTYLEDQLNRKFEALRRLTDGLDTRLKNIRRRLEASERAVIDYRNRNFADGFTDKASLEQQIGDLSRRLSQTNAEQAELESELTALDAIIEKSGPVAAAGLFDSPLIEQMRSQIIELRQRQSRVPDGQASQLQNVETEITRLEAMIAAEVHRLRVDRANRAQLGEARVAAVRAELRELEARAIEQAEREVRQSQLERDHAAELAVYGTFLDKFTQTSESLDLQEGDAQIIAYAAPPAAPVAPNKKVAVGLGGVAGGLAGTGLVFLLAMTDNRVRRRSQLSALLPDAHVFVLPRTNRLPLHRPDPLAAARPLPAPLTEGIHAIRNHLLLMETRGQGLVVAVVSTRREAAKTTTSLLLARSIAQMGISCLVVDADLRRADVARRLRLPAQPDLVDVLDGVAPLESALQHDPGSPVRVLSARSGLADPAGVLLSEATRKMVRELRQKFQVVIIDAAPLMPVSDAAPMVKIADHVLLMVRYGSPEQEVDAGLAILAKLNVDVSIALSMAPRVSRRKHDRPYSA